VSKMKKGIKWNANEMDLSEQYQRQHGKQAGNE